MDPQRKTEIDEKLAALQKAKNKWTHVNFAERIQILEKIMANFKKYQREWVETVLKERKLNPNQADDELSSGFLPVIRLCRLLIETMKPAAAAEKANRNIEFAKPPSVKKVDGQTIVTVFPWGRLEGLLMPGITAEVWIQQGHELEQGTELLATYKKDEGKVSLILGAGNQNSIPIEDAFFKLFNQNQVVILKYNPVNDYIKPLVEKILQPLIENDYFHHVSGGAEEAQYIIEKVDNIHITGSARTHDLIVWGTDDPAKKKGQPKLTKEITSELGCVTPFIVVPGDWTDAQLQWQAENIAGAVTHNNSYNCTSAKILVTCKNWKLRQKLLSKVKEILKKVPARYAYYVGSEERYKKFMQHYPNAEVLDCPKPQNALSIPWTIIENVPAREGEYVLTVEPFCPILSEVSLDAQDAVDFLQKAVPFCNDKIWGNLSCTLIVDPVVQRNHSKEVEKAIKDLKYGTVALNIWSSFGFVAGTCPWGAYPGNPLHDISSGRGFVHNSFLIDHIEKCVIRAPMTLIMGTRLPYFPTHRNGVGLVEAFIEWESSPTLWNTLKFLYQALRG